MTTPVAPAMPTTAWSRLRWAMVDGWIVVRRDLWHLRAQPGQVIGGSLIFPAVLTVLFGYVFGSAISVPGNGNYREYLMPGLFSVISIFGVVANAIAIAGDKSKGVMDRFRSMPMARVAVPFGQAGSDIIVGMLSVFVMAVIGLLVGWRAHNGLAETLAALGLIVLFRYATSWVGVYLGLAVKDPQTVESFGPMLFPVTMLGNTFVPTTHMPAWMRIIADWNPISAITAATRELFGNPAPPANHYAWPMQHPITASLAWCAVLLVVFIPLSVRTYRSSD
jgi:ABC-2 type transport system permease protein